MTGIFCHSRPRLRGDKLQRESRENFVKMKAWMPAFAGMTVKDASIHVKGADLILSSVRKYGARSP
jgi:hypothetical protein